ncbi:MAG TPA: hypothetical protein VE089_01095 [Nitrososphaeraceae archaeon]|jgi:hypothetical protein|nr:hypothetical protein [Nitrososphaeraceae archaeon]
MTGRKNKPSEFTGSIVVVVIASMLMIIVSGAVFNNTGILANAQKTDKNGSEFGTIASIQNGKDGKPAWVTSGIWDFTNMQSNSPIFNATFQMFMLNGSAAHKHTITDFKVSGKPTTSNEATTYNGTATVSLKKGPATGVPISIKLMGDTAVSIWVDPGKTENHFGNTPIYGAQQRLSPS